MQTKSHNPKKLDVETRQVNVCMHEAIFLVVFTVHKK